MGKAERKARRAARRAARADRREKLQKLLAMAKNIHLPDDQTVDDTVAKFKEYWPFVKAGLQWAESLRVTGNKVDERLNKVIAKGDSLAADADLDDKINAMVDAAEGYWEKARSILTIATAVTNDKVDDAIDKIIDIGDDFFNYEE